MSVLKTTNLPLTRWQYLSYRSNHIKYRASNLLSKQLELSCKFCHELYFKELALETYLNCLLNFQIKCKSCFRLLPYLHTFRFLSWKCGNFRVFHPHCWKIDFSHLKYKEAHTFLKFQYALKIIKQTRQVYNGPKVVKFITAILPVYQYFLGKNFVLVKKYLGKSF